MRPKFSPFFNHLDFAHQRWAEIISPEDSVIDATVGNGQDILFLAKLGASKVIGLDIQEAALEKTRHLLIQNLSHEQMKKIVLYKQSHEGFPSEISPHSIKLIVYNLGYLPGSDKTITTRVDSTLASLREACELLASGGMISLTCYSGHSEGKKEEEAILPFVKNLPVQEWNVTYIQWIQRSAAPSLFLIQKKEVS